MSEHKRTGMQRYFPLVSCRTEIYLDNQLQSTNLVLNNLTLSKISDDSTQLALHWHFPLISVNI